MSSSTLVGNETLAAENQVENLAVSNLISEHGILDGIIAPAVALDLNPQATELSDDVNTLELSPKSGNKDIDPPIEALPEISKNSLNAEAGSAENTAVVRSVSVPAPPIHQKGLLVDSPKHVNNSFGNRVVVDTTAPFDSVKEAVSKFGGIVDWKAHKIKTAERRKFIEQKLDKAREDVPIYRKMSQTAEEAKVKVLNELSTAKRLIEDMKLNVERAETKEHHAKQDAELAKLRVEEIEQGITEESSVAGKAQLEVSKARHAAAISELQFAKEELAAIRKDYAALLAEKDMTVKKAEEAKAAANEVEKIVEDLTIELISTKESLESAHAKHLEAEEGRLTAVLEKEQNSRNWEKELKGVQDEVAVLSERLLSGKELQSKLDTASASLRNLKEDLANYKESKLNQSIENEILVDEQRKSLRRTHTGMEASVDSAQKELEDVRLNIEKAIEEVNLLKLAASLLESGLENEKATVSGLKQKQGTKAEIVHSLETEINQVDLDIAEAKVRETEAREKMMSLPMQLPQAAEEADRVKSLTQLAREELEKVKDDAQRAKAGAITMVRRLVAAEKAMEAAKASENLALAAIEALQESEIAQSSTDSSSPALVVISSVEYYELSKRAQEEEEQAYQRVATAIAKMEKAKETQLKSMEKLEQVDEEVAKRKEALKVASGKAEEAAEGKLSLEQEFRKWRASNEQRPNEYEPPFIPVAIDSSSEIPKSRIESGNYIRLPTAQYASPPRISTTTATETDASSPDVGKPTKKKKRSFFPRVLMFLAKRKMRSSK